MRGKVNFKKLTLLLLIPLVLVGVYFLSTGKQQNSICEGVEININYKTEQALLSEKDIYKMLGYPDGEKSFVGKNSGDFDINAMEKRLRKYKTIQKAEIYMGISGNLIVEIKERNPVVRVIPEGKSGYYICEDRVKIPLSSNFTPDLIPATGFMNDLVDRKLHAVVGFVNNNSFWKEQIEQFFVSANGDISFIPFSGVHEVILGDTTDMDEKFKRLDVFYKKGLSKIGWDKYKTVNLKFKGQVICK